jgi:hypothetical protein
MSGEVTIMHTMRGISMKVFHARRYFTLALAVSLLLFISTLKANAQTPQEALEY